MDMSTYVIAEIGINHNNSYDNCIKLINAAAAAGCQAAKFQLFTAKALYPRSAGKLDWVDGNQKIRYDIYNAVEKFELPPDWIPGLISHCDSAGVEFLSSVFDPSGLEILGNAGVKKIKLSSYTITNIPLLKAAAETGLPIIMSTGGASLAETEKAVETILRFHDRLTLLHCSIKYPSRLDECNLGVLKTIQYAFPGLDAGYSDHTLEVSDAAMQSVYLGAKVIEKHITLDKKMTGPDHFFALEPDELLQMVHDVRLAEKQAAEDDFRVDKRIFGNSAKVCYAHERYLRDFCYMTLFFRRDMKKGEQIRPEDIIILRPGKSQRGLEPEYLDLFDLYKILINADVKAEEPVKWENIL